MLSPLRATHTDASSPLGTSVNTPCSIIIPMSDQTPPHTHPSKKKPQVTLLTSSPQAVCQLMALQNLQCAYNISGANISPLTPIYLKHSDEGAFVCPFQLVICQKARTRRFQEGQKEPYLFTKLLSKKKKNEEEGKCLEKINFKKINNTLIWKIARTENCTQIFKLLEGVCILGCHFHHYGACPLPRVGLSQRNRGIWNLVFCVLL